MAFLKWFGKVMGSASNYFKPKTPTMTPIPCVCTPGSRVEVIRRGGREMVEGTVLRYMPSRCKDEVLLNEKGIVRSELVDISALTPQRPSDEDNLSLEVFSIVDVKVEENVWFSGIIISEKGKEVRLQIPNESSVGGLVVTEVKEVIVQIFTESGQDYCVLVDISKVRRHEYRQSDLGSKNIAKSIGIVAGRRAVVSDKVWSDRYNIMYLDLVGESSTVGEVISTRDFYMSYLSWKLLHSFYEFFHVSDMASATKIPMEFSAAALLYISLAYIPLLSSPFFDVASSLENWEEHQKMLFFILGLGAVAKHIVLTLILVFSRTMSTQWMEKCKYLALCAVAESTAFLIYSMSATRLPKEVAKVSSQGGCKAGNITGDAPRAPPSPLDYDVVVILAAMLCALVCALGLNTMLQCVVRCTRRAVSDPVGWVAHRRANAGLKREEVVALPVATYHIAEAAAAATAGRSPARQQQQQHAPAGCAICLSDFADGERIRVLPVCGHRFHVVCIDRWLVSHCSCPTCRRRLISSDSAAVGGHDRLQVLTAV